MTPRPSGCGTSTSCQHECYLEVRTPRAKLPDGRVVQIEAEWFGKLSDFTLLFEALVLALAQQMPFAAVARLVNESWHRDTCDLFALCRSRRGRSRPVEGGRGGGRRDLLPPRPRLFDHTADAEERKVVFVTEGRNARTIARFAEHLATHKALPEQITSVSIDMSPAFMRGVADHLPKARITFDKFHVVAHASAAVDHTRRLEQRLDPSLKGLRWTLLKDSHRLSAEGRTDLDALISQATTKRTARAWLYREQLREILDRKQINVVSAMLKQWCTKTNVHRSKSLPSRRRGSSR
jgi:transposase